MQHALEFCHGDIFNHHTNDGQKNIAPVLFIVQGSTSATLQRVIKKVIFFFYKNTQRNFTLTSVLCQCKCTYLA